MTNNYLKFYHTILLVILASLVISNVNCKTKPKYASRYCGDDFVKVWKAACLFKKKHNTLFKRELYGKKEIFLNFQWILKDIFIRNIFISNTTNITLKSYLVRTKKIYNAPKFTKFEKNIFSWAPLWKNDVILNFITSSMINLTNNL